MPSRLSQIAIRLLFVFVIFPAATLGHAPGAPSLADHAALWLNSSSSAEAKCEADRQAHLAAGIPFTEACTRDNSYGTASNCPSNWYSGYTFYAKTEVHQYRFCLYGPPVCPSGQAWNETTQKCDSLTPSEQARAQKNNGACQRDAARGNPCNAATGNKYQVEEDYRSPDGSLTYTRAYNSQINRGTGVGRNWTTNHHRRLEIDGAAVLVRQADGRGEPFICTNSACQADPDAELALLKHASGYKLYLRHGTVEDYNLQGRLVSSQDRNGRTIQYSYDAQGRLIGITGPFGHHLTLIWNTNIGAVVGLVDPAGNTTTYTYVPAGPSYNLIQVTYPDGSYKVYHYENPSYPNHLTGISDENGQRFATYAYDSQGRAISTEHAGGQERFGFDYQ